MLTTPRAARLLASLTTPRSLDALAAALGFEPSLRLDRHAARRLGLPDEVRNVRVARGLDTLRAVLLELPDAAAERAALARLCRHVARAAPDYCWLLLGFAMHRSRVVIGIPGAGGTGQVAALEIDPRHVAESDAEVLAALAGAGAPSALARHLRWREILGRDALSARFYRDFDTQVRRLADSGHGRAPATTRQALALLHASRLLFVAFLEARGWLNGDREFLRNAFAARVGGRGAHVRLLEPLWFGTLNTPWRCRAAAARAFGRIPFLNGGLFTRTALERRHRDFRLSDDALAGVIGDLLGRYRLTARERHASWAESAVDPEMLGRTFESLMQPETRRARGAYYTPPAMIEQLTADGLAALVGARRPAADAESLLRALRSLRVCDPACGSGAFLVHALETLAVRIGEAGDARSITARRRAVLSQQIFGVDVDPTAVWLCQLRLWLAVLIDDPGEDPMALAPLPNLDHNVREGDALAGDGFATARWQPGAATPALRLRYVRASGARKRTLGRALQREERRLALAAIDRALAACRDRRRELLLAARSPRLFAEARAVDAATGSRLQALRLEARRLRQRRATLRDGGALPFSFSTHFPEIAGRGGFDLVLGNPPWVRPHAVDPAQRAALRERFRVFRDAAWVSGADAAAAGRGFGGQVDLAALFTERAVQITCTGGALALLLPAKLWSALAGGGLRALLAAEAPPLVLDDWSEAATGFDAVVYPSGLVAGRTGDPPLKLQLRHRHGAHVRETATRREHLALDASPGAPWLLVPPEVRASFDAVAAAGIALSLSPFGRPTLGVKSGCNAAFVVTHEAARRAGLPAAALRPLLRGEDLDAWRPKSGDARILWTHGRSGQPLRSLGAATEAHLQRWRSQLERRSDARGAPWWSLFRTEASRSDCARVVWGDIGRAPRAVVLAAGDPSVPLNSCYCVFAPTDDDAHALATLLNSPVGSAWLGIIAEPARGGYRRFLGWTCARFPVPRDWDAARAALAPIGRAAALGKPPEEPTLLQAVLHAYGLDADAVAPLLAWTAR